MRIINKTTSARYLGLIDRTVGPKERTPDKDPKGFRAILQEIIRKIGTVYTLQLTAEEKALIQALLKLDQEGQAFKFEAKPVSKPAISTYLLEAEKRAKQAQEKEIVEVRSREEAIQAETTYASRRDKEDAHKASRKLQGEVVAKKLASTGSEEISLSDLMGDNRFIEEHLKDSKIAMDLSNTEGWKAPEKDEPVTEEHVKALEAQLPPDGKEPNPFAPDAPVEPMESATPISGEDVLTEESVLTNEAPQKKSKKNRKNRKSQEEIPEAVPADVPDAQ